MQDTLEFIPTIKILCIISNETQKKDIYREVHRRIPGVESFEIELSFAYLQNYKKIEKLEEYLQYIDGFSFVIFYSKNDVITPINKFNYQYPAMLSVVRNEYVAQDKKVIPLSLLRRYVAYFTGMSNDSEYLDLRESKHFNTMLDNEDVKKLSEEKTPIILSREFEHLYQDLEPIEIRKEDSSLKHRIILFTNSLKMSKLKIALESKLFKIDILSVYTIPENNFTQIQEFLRNIEDSFRILFYDPKNISSFQNLAYFLEIYSKSQLKELPISCIIDSEEKNIDNSAVLNPKYLSLSDIPEFLDMQEISMVHLPTLKFKKPRDLSEYSKHFNSF